MIYTNGNFLGFYYSKIHFSWGHPNLMNAKGLQTFLNSVRSGGRNMYF